MQNSKGMVMQKKDQPAVAKRKPTEHSSEKKNGTKKFKSEHHLCVFCKEPKHKAEFSNSQLKKGSNGMCNDAKTMQIVYAHVAKG